jgi:hypothetical protein
VKKKSPGKKVVPQTEVRIDQRKKDRVAAIISIMIGLLSIRLAGSILLGVTTTADYVPPWFLWYMVAMGFISVIAGVGMWRQREWSITLSLNILSFHGIVFLGLIGINQFGQSVSMTSLFSMMLTTFSWLIIFLLLKWKRQEQAGNK